MDVIPEILERLEALEKKSNVHPAPGATVIGTPDQTTPEEEKPQTTPAAQQTRATARRAAAGAGSGHQYQ